MPEKLTLEIAKERFKNRGLILDEEVYIDKDIKMNCHDKNGYKYYLNVDAMRDIRTKNFETIGIHNPYFIHNLENFIRLNNGDVKVLSKGYVTSRNKIELQCSCGNKYEVNLQHFITYKKFKCNKCSFEKRGKNQIQNGESEVFEIVSKLGYELLEFRKRKHLIVKDKLGYIYKTTLYNITNDKNSFDKFQRFNKNNPYTIQNMTNYLKINNMDIKLVDETTRQIQIRKDYIDFYCIDCGKPFKAMWGQVAYYKKDGSIKHRCDRCSNSQSNLEYIVEKYLIEKEIEYIRQYRFNDCRNVYPYPFDYYLPKYNTILEVHGQQHYEESPMFSQSLKERQSVDKFKMDYCIKNNINYIEIPYWKITNKHKIKGYKILIDNILD